MKVIIPSDDLLRWRELCLHWAPLFRLLELLPQFRLVIDANVIIEDLLFLTQRRKNPAARTHLQEVIDSGAVVALAPFELWDEIEEHIPRLAIEEGVPEEALRGAWLEYQSRIRFIAVGQISEEEAAAAVDPDDLPYVRLCHKVRADAVVSRDWHITALGAQSVEREVLKHVRDYAREKTPEIVLRVGTYGVTIPAVAGLHALGKIIGGVAKGFAKLPREAQLLLLVGAILLIAHARSRKAVAAAISAQAARAKEPALQLLHAFGTLCEELAAAEQRVQVEQELLERAIPFAAKRPLRLVAQAVCLEAGRALTAAELTRGVLRAGYVSQATDLTPYLLRVLRRCELFVRTPDGRWTVRANEDLQVGSGSFSMLRT